MKRVIFNVVAVASAFRVEFSTPGNKVMTFSMLKSEDALDIPAASGQTAFVAVEGKGPGYQKVHQFLRRAEANEQAKSGCQNTFTFPNSNPKEPPVQLCTDHIAPPCVAYSFGINNEWDFDDHMLSLGCKVYSYDPSMKQQEFHRNGNPNHLFRPIGIGANTQVHTGKSTLYGGTRGYNVQSLADMMTQNGDTQIDVLRMDVESAEWDVLKAWTRDNIWPKIDQLLMEIHMNDDSRQEEYGAILNAIPMKTFHVAHNKHGMRVLDNDSKGPMYPAYEYGFNK